MPRLRTLEEVLSQPLRGRAVLVRVDFNVPRSGDEILDDTRIRQSLETLRELSAAGARTVVISHGGRPKGRVVPEMSLRPVAPALAELVGEPVVFGEDCIGAAAAQAVDETQDGGFCLLENLRFHPGEEANDPDFAAALARHADLYVDDAFGCCHRAHASIVGVPRRAAVSAAGRLVAAERNAFHRLLTSSDRPFVAALGGAKIRGKIDALDHLLGKVDTLLVAGAMANTFLAAQGHDLGASKVAGDELDLARSILERAADARAELRLPVDLVVTDRIEAQGDEPRRIEVTEVNAVPEGTMAVDIGPDTVESYAASLRDARIAFWNGPSGVFEVEPFDRGSRSLARALSESVGFTVVGGGETVAALNLAGVAERIGHVSTGGGASLALVAGQSLPGIEVLEES